MSFLDDFCGSTSSEIWNNGYLAPCFLDAAVYGILYIFILIFGPFRIIKLWKFPICWEKYGWRYTTKLVCHVVLILFPLLSFIVRIMQNDYDPYQIEFYWASMLAWSMSLVVFVFEFSKLQIQNWVLKVYWTFGFLVGALKLQTIIALLRDEEGFYWEIPVFIIAFVCNCILMVVALFFNSIPGVEDDYKKITEEEKKDISLRQQIQGDKYGTIALDPIERPPNPELSSNPLSRAIYSWVDPILEIGYRRVLEDYDLYSLNHDDQARNIMLRFSKFWERELNRAKPSVLKALSFAFGARFMVAGVLKLINDALTFVGPYCLNRIVLYIQESEFRTPDPMPSWEAYTWVGVMAGSAILLSVVSQYYFFIGFRIGMRVRASLVTAVYEKSFKLSSQSRTASSTGEIVNHMSIDATRLMELVPYLHLLWSGPLQIIVCLAALSILLGWTIIPGILLMVVLIPVNGVIVGKLKKLQLGIMKSKDARVRAMNELLHGIKVIKFFAWEFSFQRRITTIRDEELLNLRKTAILSSFVTFMWMSTPLFVSIVTFITYTLAGNELTATTAFTSLSLFNILRFPLNILPSIITQVVQASVSLKRLSKYLLSEEIDPHVVQKHKEKNDVAVSIANGEFTWTSDDSLPSTLREINLRVRHGELVAVVGSVGSGKSSLLSSILGDIKKKSGRIDIYGSVAYVAQEAWIQNATLRDNILFGLPWNEERYNLAVKVCELEQDLNILPNRDLTEIGEKGINLSGGQKQRVSMARAVFANTDIYLLDDPLSAVDAHVGKNIFNECIAKALDGRTRILVTHQLQHLHNVDTIIVMKNGSFSEMGSYQELMENGHEFAELMNTHVNVRNEEEEEKEEKEEEDKSGKPKGKSAGGIIQQEERTIGEVSANVYWLYVRSLGGVTIVSVLLAFFFLEQLSKVTADWWLSWWADDDDQHSEWLYLGVYLAIGVASGIFVLVRSLIYSYTSLNSAKVVHERLLDNVLRIPMSFFETTPTGRIINRFSKDQYVIDQGIPRTMSMLIVMLFSALTIFMVIGIVTPFFLTAVPPLAYIYISVQRFYIRSSRELQRLESITRSPIFSQFDETLNGVVTIKAYDRAEAFILQNEQKLDTNQRAFFLFNTSNRWLGVRLEFVGAIVVSLASLFCVMERDNINAGSAGLSLTYALQTTALLNWLVRMYTETEAQMVSVERLEEYSTIEREAAPIIDGKRPPYAWPERGEIVFDNLQLRYREGLDLVLRGISAHIRPSEKIGVVGRTGAGKSTLMLALFRIIEPAGGSVTIDGINITQIGLEDLRKKLSIIPQDPTLFTGTIRTNLDPFNDYNDNEIWNALRAVHLFDFVEQQPLKINAPVAEGGGNLSVGQRQLLCLGRALLRRSKVLVMDEATASVDYETDSLIQQTIRTEFEQCTVLTIAHRINTILNSDRVMVLDFGKIIEFDSPDTLRNDPSSVFYSLLAASGTVQN